MAVIECLVDISLERLQFAVVADKTISVQFFGPKFDHHDIVMPVQAGTLMILGQM